MYDPETAARNAIAKAETDLLFAQAQLDTLPLQDRKRHEATIEGLRDVIAQLQSVRLNQP